jgi:hypothetical protein
MSDLYDDIARGCLENGEPIEARWGSGWWSAQPDQEQPSTDMDIWIDLQIQIDQLRAENERLRSKLVQIRNMTDTSRAGYHVFLVANEALNEVTK